MESTFLTQPFSVFFIEVDACETNRLCKCYFSRRKIYVVQNVVEKSFKLLIFIVIAENEKASLSFRCQAKQIASDGIALSFLCRLFYKLKEQLQGYCAIWIATLNTNSALCTAPWYTFHQWDTSFLIIAFMCKTSFYVGCGLYLQASFLCSKFGRVQCS